MKTVGGKYYYIVVCLWFVWTVLAAGAGKNLVAGIKYFVMTTDSMAPTIPSGSIVVVKQKEAYLPGEIIAFWAKVKDKEEIVAHRIAALGGNTYITAGDQNEAWDAVPVVPRLVIGKVELVIKKSGWIIGAMRDKTVRWITVVFPVALVIINELFKIKKELNHESTHRR